MTGTPSSSAVHGRVLTPRGRATLHPDYVPVPLPDLVLGAADPDCPRCYGGAWVCEDHPEVDWRDGDGCCGAAGQPCACTGMDGTLDPTTA